MVFKKFISKNYLNIKNWRSNKKYIVFESDDWGSIRTPSKDVLKKMQSLGIDIDKCHYTKYDSLASNEDIDRLSNLLVSYKDKNGNNAVITTNFIMSNPDFEKIKNNDFKCYYNEEFSETLLKYPKHDKVIKKWDEAFKNKLFKPQFHGREHIHVNKWMHYLNDPNSIIFKLFKCNVCSLSSNLTDYFYSSYLSSYDMRDKDDEVFVKKSISEGLNLFYKTFGYLSQSTIAPNYTWNEEVEIELKKNGVHYLQGGKVQRSPNIGKSRNDIIRHHTGQKNKLGQIYLVRNCLFEPSSDPSKDWVSSCLKDIQNAFYWNSPAIIETHRVNYIGYINKKNSEMNIKLFNILINKILKIWPDVEFITSDKLGNLIHQDEK